MRFVVIGLVLSILVFVPQFASANTAPVADASGPYEGTTGEPVVFDASASFDADGDPLTYSWDFGDGATGVSVAPINIYTTPGIYAVSLVVNDGIENSSPDSSSVEISLRPPSCTEPEECSPENGASSVAFPLILEWEEVSGAESYFYNIFPMEETFLVAEETSGPLPQEALEFLSPKPYGDYRKQCEEVKEGTCSEEDIQRTIVAEQRHYWRVKSCTLQDPPSPDDPSCGPWSDPPWSLVYIPQPPEDLEQPVPGSSNVALPVRLEWTEVENIGSYVVDIRLDIGCSILDNVVGFFIGGECDPLNFFTEAIFAWFGFGENYDPSCPWNLWNKNAQECVPLPILSKLNQEEPPQEELLTEYQDAEQRTTMIGGVEETIEGQCVFSKNADYKITIASCLDKQARVCGEWSEQWTFSTGSTGTDGTPYTLSPPIHLEPEYDPTEPLPVVGKGDSLRWKADNCVSFVRLFVAPVGESPIISETLPNLESVSLSDDKFEELWDEPSDLDKEYVWNLEPCWRIENDISCEEVFSDEWHFKTVGDPPLLESPEGGGMIKVPGQLSWEKKGGVQFYNIQIASDENFTDLLINDNVQSTSFAVTLENGFLPNTHYWWRVRVCGDEEGTVCGEWSSELAFQTYPLNTPATPINPLNEGQFTLPGALRWQADPGANYYQYHVEYACKDPEETLEECPDIPTCDRPEPEWVSVPLIDGEITSNTSFYLSNKCAGKYQWAVASCADKDCAIFEPQDPADVVLWTFTAKEVPAEERFGLVPCARNSNNDATPYNEKEACGMKHIGFLLQNILDFVLWKLSLIILAILAVFVGASTYFSFGSPDVITRIRAVFRSYFYGVLILLFAWAIVNTIMAVFGFNITFFGNWFEIPF